MPAEILGLVLNDAVLVKLDILALGLSSELLWPHVLHHVRTSCRKGTAIWAGTEIACTSTHLVDLPPSFEKDKLALKSVPHVSLSGGRMVPARRINWAAVGAFRRPDEEPERAWLAAFKAMTGNGCTMPKSFARSSAQKREELISVSSNIKLSCLYAPWRLRNLTTNEFVRCHPRSASPEKRGYVDHPEAPWLRVDDVILMRICWTSPSGGDTGLDFDHGPWAGHCFDIVKVQAGEPVIPDGWHDVTNEIVAEARKLQEKVEASGPNEYLWW